jgi:hypothetical protein
MSLTRPQSYSNRSRRIVARVTVLICLLFLMALPALAEPVTIKQVVQTLSTSKGVTDLRINSLLTQDQGQKSSTQQSGPATQSGTKTDSLISGVTTTGQGQRIGVETISEGEVEGTICDCGEIFIAGGGFPKWPFLFLGAIPLAFIDHDCDTCDTTVETPTPTPTPPSTPTPTPTPQVPEPASLLLFGTGLAAASAGLRRRYGKAKAEDRQ